MQGSVPTRENDELLGPVMPMLFRFNGAFPVFTTAAKSGGIF